VSCRPSNVLLSLALERKTPETTIIIRCETKSIPPIPNLPPHSPGGIVINRTKEPNETKPDIKDKNKIVDERCHNILYFTPKQATTTQTPARAVPATEEIAEYPMTGHRIPQMGSKRREKSFGRLNKPNEMNSPPSDQLQNKDPIPNPKAIDIVNIT